MPEPTSAPRPGGRLARRLFGLFVLAALLPLALSDWLSQTALSQLADGLDLAHRNATTRQVSRQVLDRLMAGRVLLDALPAEAPGPGAIALTDRDGRHPVFRHLAWLDPQGRPAWRSDPGRALPAELLGPAARSSGQGEAAPVSLVVPAGADGAEPPPPWLVVRARGGSVWLAEFEPAHLWAPVVEAGNDSAWRVADGRGRTLYTGRGGDYPAGWAGPGQGVVDAAAIDTEAHLYLAGAFDASDLSFVQRSLRPELRWKGMPLGLWLGLVALATLLTIAGLSRWQIRRTLEPLERLTEGTRRLADGASSTRVSIRRDDEIGSLASAFNHMADRLEVREGELVHRARHDSLTGLANRHGLYLRLDDLLATDAPHLAVLFIDLDHFKDVNDSRGHAAGDELLCQASRRLQACAPPGALVARQGGDEFAIVLPGADRAQAESLADAAIEAMARAFTLDGSDPVLGASIGIALCPADGTRREDLLRRADVALYAAKAEGRGRHRHFSVELDRVAHDRMRLLAELRLALERDEFVVHYQPRVLATDRHIRSAEALVRWQHPERGLRFPGDFIALAETAGLIDAIGTAVLAQTCAQLARWRAQGLMLDRISVNVSPQQLLSGRLPGLVRGLLDRHDLPGTVLELEVTESLLVGDASQAIAQLDRLRGWGITVALDDFGTGYSSMATLRQLPIDVMKVDRSFVTDVCDDQGAQAVTSAIIALARALNLHLVAEGIETTAQARLLSEMGCDELQGFLFSRALPAEQFERLPGLQWERAALAL